MNSNNRRVMNLFIGMTLGMLLLITGTYGQQKSLKVMVLYDMEGVSGATDYRHTVFLHTPEYTECRKSLTADVNAAIAGLKAGGATEIVVVDGHGSGNTTSPDVLQDQLLPPARMISRDASFDIYMDSYDHSFDAIVAIAMHAGAGNSTGFISHTYTFEDAEYKVNGIPFNESMILAAGAARYKIPLIMVSGDDQLEKELLRQLPWVKYAAVKHALSRSKAETFPREEVSRRIESATREALQDLANAKIPEWHGPCRFALTFQDEGQARNAALVPGAELLSNGLAVQIRAGDFEEGYRQSLRLIRMAGQVASMTALDAVSRARPEYSGISAAIADWEFDRFLKLTAQQPGSSGAARPRFWGAR